MLWIHFLTWFKGELVGQDALGNRYYREKHAKSFSERRWVLYKGLIEASKVPPEWHGWLHHTYPLPPSTQKKERWPWAKKHLPNLTGTPYAYKPPLNGPTTSTGEGYKAWRPSKETHENKFT